MGVAAKQVWCKAGDAFPWWPAKVIDVPEDEELPNEATPTLIYYYQSYDGQWVSLEDAATIKPMDDIDADADAHVAAADEASQANLRQAIDEARQDKASGLSMDLMALSATKGAADDENGVDTGVNSEGGDLPAPAAAADEEFPDVADFAFADEAAPSGDASGDDDLVTSKKDKKEKKKEKKEKKNKKEKKDKKDKSRKRRDLVDEGEDEDEDEDDAATPAAKRTKREESPERVHSRPQHSESHSRRAIKDSRLRDLKEELEAAIAANSLSAQRDALTELARYAPTLQQLKAVGVGKTVITLVNSPLQPLAKVLVQMWKTLLPEPTKEKGFVPLPTLPAAAAAAAAGADGASSPLFA
eukprot:Rhum_TRINITY_DN9193_c0_g1::Rhum_TRINITY_DN9193_c0_g1_i2::g.31513::m.31513